MNTVNPVIKGVIVVNQQGSGDFHVVGENGITSIEIGFRQTSAEDGINVILVKKGERVINEISMSTPYILEYL